MRHYSVKLKAILYLIGFALFAGLMAPATILAVPVNAVQAESTPSDSSGNFNIIWGDGQDGGTDTIYMLTEDNGESTRLLIDEPQSRSMGGVLRFDRKRVNVEGALASSSSAPEASTGLRVTSIFLAETPEAGALSEEVLPAVTGSKPWVSIMCKFSDIPDEPEDLAYFTGMYANTEPGMDHYWRELSYDIVDVAGSNAYGWFVLPQPEIYYNPTDTTGGADLSLLFNDCVGVADPSVDFSPYSGINMMFNSNFDNGYAWGGSRWTTLDGVTKSWSVTWEPPWGYADISVIAHEMGHGFGLPHSSGTYGQTYDNAWDVMSKDRYNCAAADDPTYGCMAQHTISYHKGNILGWITAGEKFTAALGSSTTITLEQLALPQTGNYKMVQIPIGGSSTHFYTVEVRRLTGYDSKVAGNAVIIHEVLTSRSRPANVIDDDGNGNTADAGAMWVVGETFVDVANNISVQVNSATATGFEVNIENALCIPTGAPETICNGVDDDCDFQIDEDYVIDDTCGVGVCQTGNVPSSCVDGLVTPCTPGSPTEEPEVTCDDIDNDCDESTDEGLQYNLTTTANPIEGGMITPDCSGTCTYICMDTVDLTASVNGGYIFSSWSGGGCSGTGACQVTMDTDKNVTADFNPPEDSFEAGFVVWSNVSGDDFDWTMQSGGTQSNGTGPSGAYDGSYYAYTEASNPNFPGKVAYLDATLDFSSMTNPLLEFNFHMYGSNMGTLSVDVFDGIWYNDVWSRTGQQQGSNGASWSLASVDLSAFAGSGSVTIRFEGVTGISFRSDMAIDLVSVSDDTSCTPTENPEITCDDIDNDCDGSTDEDLARGTTCGVGECSGNTGDETCTAGSWGGDTCDPLAGAVAEVCDDLDNNCEGSIDEGLPLSSWYRDFDNDGYGDPAIWQDKCNQPTGPPDYVSDNNDYDDTNGNIYPGGPPARVNNGSPTYHLTIQDAYNVAGDGDPVQVQAGTYTENLSIDLPKSVTVGGGYSVIFTPDSFTSIIQGDVTVSDGIITFENFVIE